MVACHCDNYDFSHKISIQLTQFFLYFYFPIERKFKNAKFHDLGHLISEKRLPTISGQSWCTLFSEI
jgi:hypothetical protein